MVQTDGRAGGQAYGHVIIKFFRMGRLLHFLPMVLRCASFARKSSAIIQRHSNFGSTTQYNMNRKTFRFILAVSAEHRTYNNTLYNIFYCIQIRGGKTRTELSDSLLRILSEQRPEKNLPEKTSVGSMAHALKIPSYEGYTAGRSLPLFTKQVFQQRTTNSKQFKETQTS